MSRIALGECVVERKTALAGGFEASATSGKWQDQEVSSVVVNKMRSGVQHE